MRSVLKNNLRRGMSRWLKHPRLSTTATLTLALGIGLTSVILSLLFATFWPMRYSTPLELASTTTSDSEQVSPSLRSAPSQATQGLGFSRERHLRSDEHRSAGNATSRTSRERLQNRCRTPGSVVCSASRSRILRQQNRTARCIQTGVGDFAPVPNAQGTETTMQPGEKLCTV